MSGTSRPTPGKPRLSPCWFIHAFWITHRRLYGGEERERLWDRWRQIDKNLDVYATRRSMKTAVVILEQRPGP